MVTKLKPYAIFFLAAGKWKFCSVDEVNNFHFPSYFSHSNIHLLFLVLLSLYQPDQLQKLPLCSVKWKYWCLSCQTSVVFFIWSVETLCRLLGTHRMQATHKHEHRSQQHILMVQTSSCEKILLHNANQFIFWKGKRTQNYQMVKSCLWCCRGVALWRILFSFKQLTLVFSSGTLVTFIFFFFSPLVIVVHRFVCNLLGCSPRWSSWYLTFIFDTKIFCPGLSFFLFFFFWIFLPF